MLHANWLNEGDIKVVGKLKVGLISAIAISVTLAMGAEFSQAREIRAKILQEKLGRLYFSAGKDEDVWPGCRWRAYRDSTDTIKSVCEGRIAESYEGVSISDSILNFATPLTSSSVAKIEAADTLSALTIGVSSSDHLKQLVLGDCIQVYEADSVRNRRYETNELLSEYSTQSGVALKSLDMSGSAFGNLPVRIMVLPVDIVKPLDLAPWPFDTIHFQITYESQCLIGTNGGRHPSPYFVALIPNISRPINRNAILTTALRYRIDTSQINNAFEFESVPQLSFLPGVHSYSAYTTDITKAKKLLKENKTAGASVSIDTYSPTLKSTSRYLQGTLTQAGYATTTVGWNEPADLRLAILPIYSDSPWVALREVLTSIAKDTIAKDKANQPVRLADQLLNDALATSDSTRRIQLLERVDRMLMEDIGAFPLFRPIIYVCAKEEIRGIKFDKDGRLDLRSIYRLKLPGNTAEVNR